MYKRTLGILCGTASLLAMTSVTAQAAKANVNGDAAQNSGLEVVTVTAERRSDVVHNIPFSVTAVSGKDLAKSGITTTAALPQIVTGLTWGGQGPWVEPSLRGVTTTVASPGSGSPIAIYLDGVYQPQQISTIMELPDVSSIEVDKGPQGTLFGRNATGGAIQINTIKPSFTPEGRINLQAGLYSGGASKTTDHLSLNGFFTGPISDTLAYAVSAWVEHTPGYTKDLRTGKSDGELFSAGVRGKLLWQPDENTKVLATAYYAGRRDEQANTLTPVKGLTAAAYYPDAVYGTKPWTGAYSYPSDPRFTLGNFGASVRITHHFDGVGTVTSTTGYNNYKPHVEANPSSAYSPKCYEAYACVDFNAAVPEQAISQEFLFNSDQFGRLQFVSGVFGFYDRAVENDTATGGTGKLAYQSDAVHFTRAIAVFTEANYKLTDALTAVAGVRYNHESLIADGSLSGGPTHTFAHKTWDNLSPRFSLKYAVNDDLNVYATYSKGFKAGVTSTGYLGAIHPPANPEKLTSYEVGAKYATRDVTFNAAFFYYDYKNLQGEFFNGLATYPFNVGSASIYGLDLDGAVKLSDEFQLKAGLTLLPRARYDHYPDAVVVYVPAGGITGFGLATDHNYNANGKRMNLAPRVTMSLTGDYTKDLSIGLLDASATLYYSSSYNLLVNGLVRQGGYVTLNAQIGLQPTGWDNWRVGLYGRNLTNEAVINTLEQPPTGLSALYGPPREIGVSLQYNY